MNHNEHTAPPAYMLHDDYLRYRSEGGRQDFGTWADRYEEDYDCDAAWIAEDYLRVVRRCEDDNQTAPSFWAWLESEKPEYRAAHGIEDAR